MNTTLIEGKQLAQFDARVLNVLDLVPLTERHQAQKKLLIGIQNERGEIYRVIKIFGMNDFLKLINKFRDLGFTDEFAENYGDKEGYDAIISVPRT